MSGEEAAPEAEAAVETEFKRLQALYHQDEAHVTSVTGRSLGPLFYATITVAGMPVEALIDPGSSASIMSYDLFRQVGPKAGVRLEDLHPPTTRLLSSASSSASLS